MQSGSKGQKKSWSQPFSWPGILLHVFCLSEFSSGFSSFSWLGSGMVGDKAEGGAGEADDWPQDDQAGKIAEVQLDHFLCKSVTEQFQNL